MPVLIPTTLDEALRALDERPHATVLAGGTDLMVEINSGHRRVDDVVAIDRLPELRSWRRSGDGSSLVIGAGCTYRMLMQPMLAALVPALAGFGSTIYVAPVDPAQPAHFLTETGIGYRFIVGPPRAT